MHDLALRRSIIAACREMNRTGVNQGTAGNIAVRRGDAMLITPSATPYDTMAPEDICLMPLGRQDGFHEGRLAPSTEWRMHGDVLRGRADVGAVVHAHSPYATVLAIARRDIPPVHYMIAAFGGTDIRCARYATFGTGALSDAALEAMEGRAGCLLANHGMLAAGRDLAHAMWLAVELETLARQYVLSLPLGPVLLSSGEIEEARAKFAEYGLKTPPADG